MNKFQSVSEIDPSSELERQRRIYETALANTADFNYIFDLQGRFIYVNAALLALWRKSLHEVVGRNFFELDYPPELAARLQRQIQQVIDTREPLRDETSYTSVFGTRAYEYILVPVFTADGSVEAVSGSTRDITERKESELEMQRMVRQLKSEQDRLAEVFRQAPSFTCVLCGPHHVFELANDRYYELVGNRDLIGRTVSEAFPELKDQGILELLDNVYRTGMEFVGKDVPITLHRQPGGVPEERYLDFVYQPIRDLDRNVTGIMVQGVDLTERRRAEQALKTSEERYRKAALEAAFAAESNAKFRVFFEQGAHFAGLLSLEGSVIEANRLSLGKCGFTREEVMGKRFWDCGWWNRSREVMASVREGVEVAAAGHSFRRESEYFMADGSVRMMDLALNPVLADSGGVLFVAATGIDITDRKQAEAAAWESDARFRRMADTAPVLIWEADVNGVRFVNRHTLDFFGCTFAEMSEKGWLHYCHPDDRAGYLRIYDSALRDQNRYESQARFRRHDGDYRWLLTTGFPNFALDGTFLGFVGSSSDVTDLKEAGEKQRQLAAELSLADRKKDEFLALLAHELRNPLAPLQSGLQMLELLRDDASATEAARAMMERQLGHMVRLIDDLLDVSRIATGKMDLRRTRVTVAEIIGTAVETARPVIADFAHDLNISVPDERIELDADLTRISQVIANLLINSAKYTPRGGRISLTAKADRSQVAIAVTDSGIGIPAEALTSIFTMFSQVDRSVERETGGLGIGLALVKGLVDLHGGTVTAASEGQGKGSTFTVKLPRLAPSSSASPLVPRSSSRVPVKKRRILVVDDHRDAALSMAAILKRRGHELAVAHDGESAIATAESFRPEVILMDVGMPGLNGYDATRRIRQQSWGKAIFVIALTGWGQETDRADSRAAGCDAHLIKPARVAAVEEVLQQIP